MKRFLIVLIVILFVGVTLVEAKMEFGNWDRWDEELPPWDNKGWQERIYSTFISFPLLEGSIIWLWVSEDWEVIKAGRSSSPGTEDVFFLLTRLSFIEKKIEASIILFSPAQISPAQIDKAIKNISIKDALAVTEFALVAFPPKKGEVVVRVYEDEDGLFRFLEEWTVVFKNKTIIIPEKTIKFSQKYESWINDQFRKQGIEERKYRLLPRLIVVDDKKKEFFIGVALEVFEKNEVKATIIF